MSTDQITLVIDQLRVLLEIVDRQTIVLIWIFTFVLRQSLWRQRGYDPSLLSLVVILLSFVLTPLVSTSEETQWGGPYVVRQSINNAGGAILGWLLMTPIILRMVPQLKNLDPTALEDEKKSDEDTPDNERGDRGD